MIHTFEKYHLYKEWNWKADRFVYDFSIRRMIPNEEKHIENIKPTEHIVYIYLYNLHTSHYGALVIINSSLIRKTKLATQ